MTRAGTTGDRQQLAVFGWLDPRRNWPTNPTNWPVALRLETPLAYYAVSMPTPPDGITIAEAARILGVNSTTVSRMLWAGELVSHGARHARRRLSRAHVEQLAVARYRRNDRIGRPPDPDSYWVTRDDAAAVLGVAPARVGQLARAGRLPFETAPDGTRLFRRAQLKVIGNARSSRRSARHSSATSW